MRTVKRPAGVQSAEVALRLLRVLIEAGAARSLSELADAAHMSPAKAHRHLVSLVREGYVEQSGADRRYDMGPQALDLANACLARIAPLRMASAELPVLCRLVDETVAVAVWGLRGPVFVRYEEPPHTMVGHVRVGAAIPVLRSASGRVLAAHMPLETIKPFVAGELAQAVRSRDRRGPRSWRAVEQVFSEVRRAGLARVQGYLLNGINAISAPVFDHRERVVFALTVLGDESHFDCFRDGSVARALRAAALGLSRRLAFEPGDSSSRASAGSGPGRKPEGRRAR